MEHFEHLQRLDAQLPFFDFVISRVAEGERREHVVTGKPYYDAAGRFLGYRGVGQDYRLRVLLRAGKPTWPNRPTPPILRTARPHAHA